MPLWIRLAYPDSGGRSQTLLRCPPLPPFPPAADQPEQTPFVRGDGDRHTVDPNDIKQDGYGSCAVLSALHTIAQQDPSVIQDMIQDNGDGTYTVTFQEKIEVMGMTFWVPVEVTVSGPFTGGAADPGDVGANGEEVWPAIIEAAYAQQYKGDDLTYETGVAPGDVLERILGEEAGTVGTSEISSSEMSDKLADGDAVVAWTPPFKDDEGNWLPEITTEQQELIEHYGIAGGHAYAVSEIVPAGTAYVDPATGESIVATEDVVILDNPWGSSDVVMPYSDYQEVYGWVSSASTD
nr:C2 family cysteine protease [Luteimonas sp. BDR2-5]